MHCFRFVPNPVWLISLLLILPCAATGELYKSTDEHGNVIYTDVRPSEEAEPVELPDITVIESVKVKPSAGAQQPAPAPLAGYAVRIEAPENEWTVHNTRQIPVVVAVTPTLQPGHRIAFSLNGETRAVGTDLSIIIDNVDRGTYRLTAAVVDTANKRIATSPAITVHVKQHSILQ